MSDSNIFLFGTLMFSILAGGVIFTVVEITRMYSRGDQNDSYPRSRPTQKRAVELVNLKS